MKKALLVDDTMVEISRFCNTIRKMFCEANIFLDFVTAADAGVAIIKNCHYDIVFMDGTFLLSGEDDDDRILAKVQGIDAIRSIRSFSAVPIVMISSTDQLQEEGIVAGANCAVGKNDWEKWVAEAQKLIMQ
jgi:CheY-like chemotaxis protein